MRRMKRAVSLLLSVLLAAALLLPAFSLNAAKTVRVGWYDSSYNTIDENGRRFGYAYDYQQKIASYTGWTYEYVEGSWPDLLEMLQTGEIDLMSDVSYTEERAKNILYPTTPMGEEEYYVFISPNNEEISPSNPATLAGKRVGVNRSSIQADFFEQWASRAGVAAEVVYTTTSENESLAMLETGELDAYVTVDAFVDPKIAVPVVKVGSSNFFFAVSKNRPDLLTELDAALSAIQDENRYYTQQLFDKYVRRAGANAFLTSHEKAFLAEHGRIRVGYQDNYLAFCASDDETGELTGVLRDYLDYAADCMANAHLTFEAIAYPTVSDALDALKAGEIDCVFPANFSAFDNEQLGVFTTPALTQTEVFAIVSSSNTNVLTAKQPLVIAVNEGNINYERFLESRFPNAQTVFFPTTTGCLHAVAEGKADCVLLSNFRYNNVARLCERHHLISLSTGIDVDYCFAVEKGETELYSILTKVVGQVSQATVNTALLHYIAEESKPTVLEFVQDHHWLVFGIFITIVLVIFLLLMQNMYAVNRMKKLIAVTETDELTGLYNRAFFFQYADRMQREHPDVAMDAIVINIEQFHSVNALNGRDFGDRCLLALASEIRAIASENLGIAGRFGADRFDIFCCHLDDYTKVFDRLQAKMDGLSANATVHLRMGVMPSQEGGMPPVEQFDHARVACSMARGHYKDRLIIFDDEVREREKLEQRLQYDLRGALENHQFVVYYQPKFDIQGDVPTLRSAEALVRWVHPELGLIFPDDFVPLFERSGQITDLDRYVWAEAARQVARWRDKFGYVLPVSVNLSRVDAVDPTLEETLDKLLEENGLDYSAMKLEVTESAYTENADQMVPVIERLRKKGFEIEMDDFGTGYSSLNMLSDLPLDFIKMDQAFVRNLTRDRKGLMLVEMVLGIARNLIVPVVAEGVETEEQLKTLKEQGCEIVQGYYFSRPLPAGEFEKKFLEQ